MQSKWVHVKEEAIRLRRQGCSLRDIEIRLGIPRSTLSGWLKNVKLTAYQKKLLDARWRDALLNARGHAALWHTAEKAKRLESAKLKAENSLLKINVFDRSTIELALAMLYLGEGFKGESTGLGNSDPLILNFFLGAMVKLYELDINKIRLSLNLRADQDPQEMKKFWSIALHIPLERFKSVSIDKRTIGKPTYPHYKCVCTIVCGNVAIQRKLIYLSRAFCGQVLSARSSIGRASH